MKANPLQLLGLDKLRLAQADAAGQHLVLGVAIGQICLQAVGYELAPSHAAQCFSNPAWVCPALLLGGLNELWVSKHSVDLLVHSEWHQLLAVTGINHPTLGGDFVLLDLFFASQTHVMLVANHLQIKKPPNNQCKAGGKYQR